MAPSQCALDLLLREEGIELTPGEPSQPHRVDRAK